ncbi:MAG: GTP-binding protein [Bacteroidales bacterium]|nr:GTP-binding protein [Bacteroidales bacterium]
MSDFQEKQDGYLNMQLLRFTTAGSVDDGKSTLIGRLLYDSKAIFEDQMEAIERASINKGDEHVNLALLTDGLRAEREQGITIDVAYRYFATPKRKFIIADTPGHVQYTRNMVTGASTANAAIILVDARNGVVEQTLRHSFIASLLQIPHIIICVNKMDLVDYEEEIFEEIRKNYESVSDKFDVQDIRFVPISALNGDNVVDRSKNMNWYDGPTLMYLLENIHITNDRNFKDPRYPVQYVIRPQSEKHHDFRGYGGRIAGGVFKPDDKVTILPSGFTAQIHSIETMNGKLDKAFPPQSVVITLKDDLDISRGDMIVTADNQPKVSQDLTFMFCWLNEKSLEPGKKYVLRHTTNEARCIVKSVDFKVNINTLEKNFEDKNVGLNEIGQMTVRTTKPIVFDTYKINRVTGSIILLDENTNETICAGMIS